MSVVTELPKKGGKSLLGIVSPLPRSTAGSAMSSTSSINVCILRRVLVSLGTVRFAGHVLSGVTPLNIDFACDRFKVNRIAAVTDSTKMVEVESSGLGSNQGSVNVDVQVGHFVLDRHSRVTIRAKWAGEEPAWCEIPTVNLFDSPLDMGQKSSVHPAILAWR